MADATANFTPKTQPNGGRHAFPIANGVTVYAGMLGSVEGGYLNHWADGANDVFAGLVLGPGVGVGPGDAMLGNTSATPIPEAFVDCSGVTLMHLSIGGTATQAKVGDLVYSADSSLTSITLDSSGRTHPIGWMSRYRSATDVDVTLFTPETMLAQATA